MAGSSQHDPVRWEAFPLNHQGHVTEGALGEKVLNVTTNIYRTDPAVLRFPTDTPAS